MEYLRKELEPLSKYYDVVVANPPYMGSSSLNKWMGTWVKKNYPESYRDLCTSFISRGFTLSNTDGYSGMVTMQSWMFLGSFEKLRVAILNNHSISSMAHLGTRAFGAIGGEVVSTTATVFANKKSDTKGIYCRLVDMGSEVEKQAGFLEALANSDCEWFYRTSTDKFNVIPGNAIVYWASDSTINAFKNGTPVSEIAKPKVGLQTGENTRFVRHWWEVSHKKEIFNCSSIEESIKSKCKWFPYNKGGEFRKWYGNNEFVINWKNDGHEVRSYSGSVIRNSDFYFNRCITWSKISSGSIAFRYKPVGHVFDVAGTSIFADDKTLKYLQGACNSSTMLEIARMLSPTLNFEVGQIATYPILIDTAREHLINSLVEKNRSLSKNDWDAMETSWGFTKHPLI